MSMRKATPNASNWCARRQAPDRPRFGAAACASPMLAPVRLRAAQRLRRLTTKVDIRPMARDGMLPSIWGMTKPKFRCWINGTRRASDKTFNPFQCTKPVAQQSGQRVLRYRIEPAMKFYFKTYAFLTFLFTHPLSVSATNTQCPQEISVKHVVVGSAPPIGGGYSHRAPCPG